MGLLDGYARAAGMAASDVLDKLFCALGKLRDHAAAIETGTTGTARTLAYQYGVPPAAGSSNLAPRSMTEGPWIAEGYAETDRVILDKYQEAGQYGYAGYVANIGDDEFQAAWLLVNGSSSGVFTVPPAATIQVPCIVRGVLVVKVAGAPARYQVSLS